MLENGDHLVDTNPLMIQKLLENLVQSGESSMDEHRHEHESGSPSSNNDTLPNEMDGEMENDAEENGFIGENMRDVHTPIEMNEDAASEMTKHLKFVGHQLVHLIRGMGSDPCMCNLCSQIIKKDLDTPAYSSHHRANHHSQQIHQNEAGNNHLAYSNGSDYQSGANQINNKPSTPLTPTHSFNPSILDEDPFIRRGRKSKYCSNEEKKAVADYAEIHGATAAGRKFDIPASVAAYYHRRLKKGNQSAPSSGSARRMPPMHLNFQTQPQSTQSLNTEAIHQNGYADNDGPSHNSVAEDVENVASRSFPSEKNDLFAPIPPRNGGGFLRGRGRGRPKLIGDELDAELVEYMVQVKRNLPRCHLTASRALDLARAYILEKAPHILEENGGHINLKITWAMKLVSRTNERYRELYGGPPSPSLLNANLSEILAQLNQQAEQHHDQTASATPEIHNVQELNFPFNGDGMVKSEFRDDYDPMDEGQVAAI